jgi:hypothetical protein
MRQAVHRVPMDSLSYYPIELVIRVQYTGYMDTLRTAYHTTQLSSQLNISLN